MKTTFVSRAAICATVIVVLGAVTPAAHATIEIDRVNLTASDGQEPLWSLSPSVDLNGDRIAYATSRTSNGSVYDIFVRDISAGETIHIDADTNGGAGNGSSDSPRISANGEYVVYLSTSTDLVSGDNNGAQDVFRTEIDTGDTELVSVSSGGTQADSYSWWPSISSNGRYVAFESSADNIIGESGDYRNDVFVKDMDDESVEQANLTDGDTEPSCEIGYYSQECGADAPEISANGQYVAFNTVGRYESADDNFVFDIYRRDLSSGTTDMVSDHDTESMGSAGNPSISSDGSVVAFQYQEVDNYSQQDIWVYDFSDSSSTRVNVPNGGGSANDHGWDPTVSPNGSKVGFWTWADNLVGSDNNYSMDGFVYDRNASSNPLSRITVDEQGNEGNDIAYSPEFTSGSVGKVVFASMATNLVPNDTNDGFDIFMRDL